MVESDHVGELALRHAKNACCPPNLGLGVRAACSFRMSHAIFARARGCDRPLFCEAPWHTMRAIYTQTHLIEVPSSRAHTRSRRAWCRDLRAARRTRVSICVERSLRCVRSHRPKHKCRPTYAWHGVMAAIGLAIPQLDASRAGNKAAENRSGSKQLIRVHPCATLCLLTRPFGGAHTACLLHGENRMVPPPGYNSRAHGALNSIYGNCSACASGALSWHAVKLAVLAARRRGGDIPCTVAVLHSSLWTGCSERMV